jgi:hypothetical protein
MKSEVASAKLESEKYHDCPSLNVPGDFPDPNTIMIKGISDLLIPHNF